MKFLTLSDHQGVSGLRALGQITVELEQVFKQEWSQTFFDELSRSQDKSTMQLMMEILQFIFDKAPREMLLILAIINKISFEEIDSWSIPQIALAMSALTKDKDTIDFFTQFSGMGQEQLFGTSPLATDLAEPE